MFHRRSRHTLVVVELLTVNDDVNGWSFIRSRAGNATFVSARVFVRYSAEPSLSTAPIGGSLWPNPIESRMTGNQIESYHRTREGKNDCLGNHQLDCGRNTIQQSTATQRSFDLTAIFHGRSSDTSWSLSVQSIDPSLLCVQHISRQRTEER